MNFGKQCGALLGSEELDRFATDSNNDIVNSNKLCWKAWRMGRAWDRSFREIEPWKLKPELAVWSANTEIGFRNAVLAKLGVLIFVNMNTNIFTKYL